MKFELPKLPYPLEALEPTMSRETLEYHWGKHHRGYVEKTNSLIQGTEFDTVTATLEDIVRRASGALFNNGAQVWNHTFFWSCLSPDGGKPRGTIADAIQRQFGSLEQFKGEFNKAAAAQFGSGWAWLVRRDDGSLAIETTANADNPLRAGRTPILTCDVWEHAYYIDYRNERAKFLEQVWNVVNWDFVEANYASAKPVAG